MVANVPTTDGLGERYRMFSGWGMAAGKVDIFLMVGWFDENRSAKVRLVNYEDFF